MRLLVTASQHFGAADIFSLTLFGLLAYAAFPRPAGIGMAVLGLPIATTGNFFPVLYGLLFIWAAPRHNPALKSIAMTGLGLLLVLVGTIR